MNQTLAKLLQRYLDENGPTAKATLCLNAMGVSERTIDRALKGQIRNPRTRYLLARAAGCSETEARSLASAKEDQVQESA